MNRIDISPSMKPIQFLKVTLALALFMVPGMVKAENPDTVSTGIYVTSIHNIDFKQKEYAINFWLWLKYRNAEFDFTKNLEIPNAKSFTAAYTTVDTLKDGRIYVLMKLECVMKDAWKIDKFPFDRQTLRLSLENSQFDASSLVFTPDTLGEHYGQWVISGWNIDKDSFITVARNQVYKTSFGDESAEKPVSIYSALKVRIGINRLEPWLLFTKLFLGMYIAFLIAYVSFFIHSGSMEERFGLNVGALFAAVGNKYIIDSSLPDTSSLALVDILHGITLLAIFAITAFTIFSLKLFKEGKTEKAGRIDRRMSWIVLSTYLMLNIYFVIQAAF